MPSALGYLADKNDFYSISIRSPALSWSDRGRERTKIKLPRARSSKEREREREREREKETFVK